jgi:hypothetical protein
MIEKAGTEEAEPNRPDEKRVPDGSDRRITNHQIRLGPPWQVTRDGALARHARNFGRPRTLDPGERVWLVCENLPGPAEVSVNGTVLGPPAAGAFAADVTDHLRPRNAVVVAVAGGGPLGEVRLEIRSGS